MDDNFEKCEYFYLENSLTALKENVFGTLQWMRTIRLKSI